MNDRLNFDDTASDLTSEAERLNKRRADAIARYRDLLAADAIAGQLSTPTVEEAFPARIDSAGVARDFETARFYLQQMAHASNKPEAERLAEEARRAADDAERVAREAADRATALAAEARRAAHLVVMAEQGLERVESVRNRCSAITDAVDRQISKVKWIAPNMNRADNPADVGAALAELRASETDFMREEAAERERFAKQQLRTYLAQQRERESRK